MNALLRVDDVADIKYDVSGNWNSARTSASAFFKKEVERDDSYLETNGGILFVNYLKNLIWRLDSGYQPKSAEQEILELYTTVSNARRAVTIYEKRVESTRKLSSHKPPLKQVSTYIEERPEIPTSLSDYSFHSDWHHPIEKPTREYPVEINPTDHFIGLNNLEETESLHLSNETIASLLGIREKSIQSTFRKEEGKITLADVIRYATNNPLYIDEKRFDVLGRIKEYCSDPSLSSVRRLVSSFINKDTRDLSRFDGDPKWENIEIRVEKYDGYDTVLVYDVAIRSLLGIAKGYEISIPGFEKDSMSVQRFLEFIDSSELVDDAKRISVYERLDEYYCKEGYARTSMQIRERLQLPRPEIKRIEKSPSPPKPLSSPSLKRSDVDESSADSLADLVYFDGGRVNLHESMGGFVTRSQLRDLTGLEYRQMEGLFSSSVSPLTEVKGKGVPVVCVVQYLIRANRIPVLQSHGFDGTKADIGRYVAAFVRGGTIQSTKAETTYILSENILGDMNAMGSRLLGKLSDDGVVDKARVMLQCYARELSDPVVESKARQAIMRNIVSTERRHGRGDDVTSEEFVKNLEIGLEKILSR